MNLLLTFGISLMTPILPKTAKGDAITLSATQVIIYPPLAATCSTQIVNFIPCLLNRCNCAAANPYPVTVPPPVCNTSKASSPGLAAWMMAVTSSRRVSTCDALTSPGKSVTNKLRGGECESACEFVLVVGAEYPIVLRICDSGRSCKLLSNPPATPDPPPAMFPRSADLIPFARSFF